MIVEMDVLVHLFIKIENSTEAKSVKFTNCLV